MRNLITSVGLGIAGFAAGIATILSCSEDPGLVGTGMETMGLEETTASAETGGLEETCSAWRIHKHNLTQALPDTFDVPEGQFPFAVVVGGSYYLITRSCLD